MLFRNKSRLKKIILFSLVFFIFAFPSLSFADNPTTESAKQIEKNSSKFLGDGFQEITKFSEENVENEMVDERGGGYVEGGNREINALLYNVKDFFKYAAGGIAVLYIIVAATQLVIATDEEAIQSAKKNIIWSIVAVVAIFAIDVAVVALFEGGNFKDVGDGAGGFFTLEWQDGVLVKTENTNLFRSIAIYFQEEAQTIFNFLKVLIGAMGVGLLALAGFHIVTAAGNEDSIEKEKKYLTHVLTAFITLLVLENLIFNFLYPADKTGVTDPKCVEFMQAVEKMPDGKINLSLAPEGCRSAAALGHSGFQQILAVVQFLETFVGAIAVFFIVYSGLQIITSFGNEEKITKYKKTLAWSVGGLAVVLLAHNLVLKFIFPVDFQTGEVAPNVSSGILDAAGIANFLLTFVSVFAVVSLIVSGVMWVVNFGNSELTDKAKKVALGSVIAIILSISAYALVSTLTRGSSAEDVGESISIGADILSGRG